RGWAYSCFIKYSIEGECLFAPGPVGVGRLAADLKQNVPTQACVGSICGSAERHPTPYVSDARGLRRGVFLQALDHAGDVGELLLEVALIVLQLRQPLVPIAEAPEMAPPPVGVMVRSAHRQFPPFS